MKRIVYGVFLLLAGCATSAPQTDLLLTGGRIFTGDNERPWAASMAIRNGTITAVGSTNEVRAVAGSVAKEIDLAGRLVVPGINDAHVHAPWPREPQQWVRPPDEATRETLLAAIRAAVTEGTTLLASELPLSLVDSGITRDDLDAISTVRPIRLTVFGGHSAILNTAALRAWGIEEHAGDPPGGSYGRTDGRLNGWLYEHAYWLPQLRHVASITDEELVQNILSFEEEALGGGITSAQTMALLPPERLEKILARANTRLRWRIMDFRLPPYQPPSGRHPMKFIFDGTPIERSAAMSAPYADDRTTSGALNYTLAEIEAIVRDAARGERQLLVHAVGDRAIAALLDAMKRTPADWPSLRVRIEHGDMITPELRAVARDLGVVLVQNPAHFTIPQVMNPRFGSERTTRSQPAKTLISEGQRFAIGSDGPLNPFLNIFFAVIHPVNPSEALTVEQALRAYTTGSAYAEFAETKKGKLAPGMLADLAVLSQDIFNVPPPELPKTTSVMTIVGGTIVWEAAPTTR